MSYEDPLVIDSDQGRSRISEGIIMTIAKNAVKDVEGIVSISGGFPDKVTSLFSRNTTTKGGVRIQKQLDHVTLNLSLVISYGVPVPHLVEQAQQKVKKAVESMTEIHVEEVNIYVHDLKVT